MSDPNAQQIAQAQQASGARPASAGGTTAAPKTGKMTRSEAARLGALARWGKYKAKPKPKGKGRKPAKTAEQKEAERRQKAQENRTATLADLDVAEEAQSAMEALAMGSVPDDAGGAELEAMGLAERDKSGALRLTAAGRAAYNAASAGDKGRTKEALSRGRDATITAKEKEKAKADAEAEAAAEAEKPKGGGGGGGKPKPSEDEKRKEQQAKREQTAKDTAERTQGASRIRPAEVDALRRAANGEPVDEAEIDGLAQLGFIEATGDNQFEATDQGRAALTALERGNLSQYQAAVQNARNRLGRETAASERRTAAESAARERETARQERETEAQARQAEKEKRDREREAARQARKKRMDRREALRVLGETQKAWEVKHGAHDQSSHGRRGPRGRASAGAYRAARAGGASVEEARQAARDVSQVYANQQRIANIDKQLDGHVSESRRASLQAERARLEADTLSRIDRTTAAAAGATRAEPTVRGRQAPAPKANGSGSGPALGSETRAYGADPNQSYTLQHKIVDMADVQASNTANGAINPKYDPALQPRDRSRAASQAQIDTVARQMNPDVLATDFHRIDAGSPIVDANGNVLSGNGRTLALQRAADLYPDQYAAYKQRIKDEAAALGIDPKAIDGMQHPVLVRELKGDADPVAFAREANSSGTLRMSPLEQAKVDADVLSDKSMLRLNVTEGHDIDRALRSKDNKAFIDDFLSTVPENERATLLTRNGELNQAGLYRIKAAVYTKVFPGEAGGRMAESMLESLDPDVKTVQNGISAALPSLSRAVSLTRSGQRDKDLDLSDDMARVVDVYARIKDNPSLTANTPAHKLVEKYLGQSTMFDRELTPQQERLLVHLDSISRKPTAVRDFLNRYSAIVEDQPPPGQISLFGDVPRMTKSQLIDTLIGSASGSASPSLFGQQPVQQPGMFP